MTKLTKRTVDAIKATDREFVVWDDELPGFGLRVKPTGMKSYVVQYKNATGRSKRATLGKHGIVTADLARKEAKQIKASVARGEDPVTEGTVARKAPKVGDLMAAYLENHVSVHNRASTAVEARRLVAKHILPGLGTLKVSGVNRQDIIRLHRKMGSTPRQANLVLSILSKAFNLAEVWGWRPDASNPTRLIKRYPETKRDRFLSADELGQLGATLRSMEQEQTANPGVLAVIWLLLLTGCRLSEVLTLKWDYLDFEEGMLILPDAKAGGRRQALSSAALDMLAKFDRIEGVEWVLPNVARTGPIDRSNMERAWRRIRNRAEIADVRLHDLRHTVGTMAGATGANAFMVRDLLGHKTLAMTGQYVNNNHDPVRGLTNEVSDKIQTLLGRGRPAATSASPLSEASANTNSSTPIQKR